MSVRFDRINVCQVIEVQPSNAAGCGMREAPAKPYAAVALNVPVEGVFHYRVPRALEDAIRPGARVRVAFGRREMVGYCVGFDSEPAVDPSRVKDIIQLLDRRPMLDSRMLELTRWMAAYYSCSWGEALDAVLPGAVKKKTAASTILLVAAASRPDELRARASEVEARAPRQARVLRVLAAVRGEMAARDVVSLAETDYSVLRALERSGHATLRKAPIDDDPTFQFGAEQTTPPTPTQDQAAALHTIAAHLDNGGFKAILLHGVTASGKTELYLQTLAKVVAAGRQGIVLVPEIALTPQTVARFKARFDRVCVLHSGLADRRRRQQWRQIHDGLADVVIGPRSAVFAPVPRLGLLVVDEEHETSFKQQTVPRYHARDVGLWRARQEGALVILGSATPSLESLHNAQTGKYELIALPRRVEDRPMPRVTVVDLSEHVTKRGKARILSRSLQLAVETTLEQGEQAILFLNRRGFHTHVACPRCGLVMKCTHCDVSLTYHRPSHTVRCHYCGHELPAPRACPACNHPGMNYRGTGTQRVEEEITRLFGEKNVARMDSDAMRGWGLYEATLAAFRDGKTGILLGTQMVAKGLDFPNVTLVGVINADTSLNMPDFRATERTFQLLMQVAGRAGRGPRGGRVIIQTSSPEHPAVQFAVRHDYEGFSKLELADREAFGYPPFGRLARVIVEGREKQEVAGRMHEIAAVVRRAARGRPVSVLGPAEAPIARIKGRRRWHVIIKAPRVSLLHDALRAVDRRRVKGTHVIVDVDPVALL